MAGKSTLDPENFSAARPRTALKGHDTRSLGPSDSSDSGSDMAGPGLLNEDRLNLDRGTNEDSEEGRRDLADAGASVGNLDMDANSDSTGTGERLTAGKEPGMDLDADRDTDRVVGPEEAGLGGGLDQAEEAQLGITDEEIEERRNRRP